MENKNSIKEFKRAVIINDMSCFGKCSLTVSLPLISAQGVEAVPLPTAILSNHTGGFKAFTCLDMTEEMKKIIARWQDEELKFDCISTGYFCNDEQLRISEEFIKDFRTDKTIVIVDPVMADNGKLYYGFNAAFVEKMKKLSASADVITPNVTEALLMAGIEYTPIQTRENIELCLERLHALGVKNVVITGVEYEAGKIGNVYSTMDGEIHETFTPRIDARLHGSGDVFFSVVVAEMTKGTDFIKAVENATTFTYKCVCATEENIDSHWYGLYFEKCVGEQLGELK